MAFDSSTPPRFLLVGELPESDETIVTAAFEELGAAWQTAPGIVNAVKIIESTTVDCVLLAPPRTDAQPRNWGELIREYDATIPIVVLGDPDITHFPQSLLGDANIKGVVAPSDTEELRSLLTRLITQRRVADELDRHAAVQSAILSIVLDAMDATNRAEIDDVVANYWLDSDLFAFAWLGEYNEETRGLQVTGPFPGRFTAEEIDALGDPTDADILQHAVTIREVVVSRGSNQFRSTAVQSVEEVDLDRPTDTRHKEPDTKQSVAIVPIGHDQTVYRVLVLLTAAEVDSMEQELLERLGQAIGKVMWLTERAEKPASPESERLKGFVDLISHEIRNPLSIAITQLERLLEDSDEAELESVQAQLRRIESILGTFRTVLQSDGVLNPQLQDLSVAATEAWEALDHPDADLFISDTRDVMANHELLERLFSNLFRNALQFGGDNVLIRIGMLDDGFYVEDNGPGIEEADRERIFEWGYSTNAHGMGVGLSFVNEIVRAHDWIITVTESDVGGARFEVTGVDVEAAAQGDLKE